MEESVSFIDVKGVQMTVPCNKLLEALAKMQGALESAKKSADNPYFKSKYADLAQCLETAKKPMADNGLSISQHCTFDGANVNCVTVLGHSSGQMMVSTLQVPVARKDAQGIGSSTTYARRYSLSAIIGMAQADDDGEGSVGRTKEDAEEKWAKKAKKEKDLNDAVQRNQQKLDREEIWRIANDGIEVKCKDGTWMNLDNMELRLLKVIESDERFAEIRNPVRDKIKEITG